jgi:hypothetical protein
MTLDARGRAATTDLRRATTQRVDPMIMLNDLERNSRAKNRRNAVAAVAAAAALIAGGLFVAHAVGGTTEESPGGIRPTTHASPSCSGGPTVTCVGANRYRVALIVPVTVTVPANFQPELQVFNATTIEGYQAGDIGATGVTVQEDAVPTRNDASETRDPAAGTTAQSMATWLAHRSFAVPTSVVRTTVQGRPAYQVDIVLKKGAPLLGKHNTDPAAPTFGTGMAAWGTLKARYTLMDVPGAGVVVIWSWTFDRLAVLDGNQAFVDSVSFG